MQEASGDVQEAPTLTLSPLHQPATAITVPAPPSSATVGTASVTVIDPDDDSGAAGPREETPERETGAWQEAEEADWKREERPMQPETPERMAPPPGNALHARADETAAQAAQDVDAFKPDDGCTTPPPLPAHGSDDDRVAASTSGKRAGVAAARSRLLAFRSFARGKKGKKSGDAARAPSPGEHLPAHGKAWEEAGADDKEKGQARWKRFWK